MSLQLAQYLYGTVDDRIVFCTCQFNSAIQILEQLPPISGNFKQVNFWQECQRECHIYCFMIYSEHVDSQISL